MKKINNNYSHSKDKLFLQRKNAKSLKKGRDKWNFIFSFIFMIILFIDMIIYNLFAQDSLGVFEDPLKIILLVLFIARLTRLLVNDEIFEFIRDKFFILEFNENKKEEIIRKKYDYGFRRSVSDIFSCPWCSAVWVSLLFFPIFVVGWKYIFPVVIIFSLAGLASYLHIAINLLGWSAEKKMKEVSILNKGE